jgi:hypothetical protein
MQVAPNVLGAGFDVIQTQRPLLSGPFTKRDFVVLAVVSGCAYSL